MDSHKTKSKQLIIQLQRTQGKLCNQHHTWENVCKQTIGTGSDACFLKPPQRVVKQKLGRQEIKL